MQFLTYSILSVLDSLFSLFTHTLLIINRCALWIIHNPTTNIKTNAKPPVSYRFEPSYFFKALFTPHIACYSHLPRRWYSNHMLPDMLSSESSFYCVMKVDNYSFSEIYVWQKACNLSFPFIIFATTITQTSFIARV